MSTTLCNVDRNNKHCNLKILCACTIANMAASLWLIFMFLGLSLGKDVPIGFQRAPFGPEGPIGFKDGLIGPEGPISFSKPISKFSIQFQCSILFGIIKSWFCQIFFLFVLENLGKRPQASSESTVVNCGNHTASS